MYILVKLAGKHAHGNLLTKDIHRPGTTSKRVEERFVILE